MELRLAKRSAKRGAFPIPACLKRYPIKETVVQILQHTVSMIRIADFEEILEGIDQSAFGEDERLPYWAELWPSSVALAQVITQRYDLSGKHALELGCGLGLAGIVAALRGGRVLCTDYEADSLVFARFNARKNGCGDRMGFRLVDWRRPALRRRYDFILASDVIYERRNFGSLAALLKRFLSRGGVALFSEPRRANTGPFFEQLQSCGLDYKTEVFPLDWEGNHLITVSTITHTFSSSW